MGQSWRDRVRQQSADEYFHARMHGLKELLELVRVRLADRGELKLSEEVKDFIEQMRKDRWVR